MVSTHAIEEDVRTVMPPSLRERYELAPRRPDVETTTASGRRLRIVYPRVRRTRRCEAQKAS